MAEYLRQVHRTCIFSWWRDLSYQASQPRGVTREALRQQSSKIVTAQMIADLDANLPRLLAGWPEQGPVVIDSPAVTSEPWGASGCLRTLH